MQFTRPRWIPSSHIVVNNKGRLRLCFVPSPEGHTTYQQTSTNTKQVCGGFFSPKQELIQLKCEQSNRNHMAAETGVPAYLAVMSNQMQQGSGACILHVKVPDP